MHSTELPLESALAPLQDIHSPRERALHRAQLRKVSLCLYPLQL